MKKTKYYPAKYFFIIIFIISGIFLAINFLEVSKNYLSYEPILNLSKRQERVLGETDEVGFLSDLNLKISKINVDVPIVFDVSGEKERDYFLALEKGVAHLKQTSKPGEKGNMVIFGHSSAEIGAPGDYNQVFAKLGELEENDEIVFYNNKEKEEFVYLVYASQIVGSDDVSIIQKTEEDRLTLFTCWPIGSDEKRLVIYAKPK